MQKGQERKVRVRPEGAGGTVQKEVDPDSTSGDWAVGVLPGGSRKNAHAIPMTEVALDACQMGEILTFRDPSSTDKG